MRHKQSIEAYLSQRNIKQEVVQGIRGRIDECVSSRGWVPITSLERVFSDGTLLNEYEIAYGTDPNLRLRGRTVSVTVEDVPQALARVVGALSGRGYNIDELSVSSAMSAKYGNGKALRVSRITITAICSDATISQIVAQVKRQVDVLDVHDLTDGPHGRARISLVKVTFTEPEKMTEAITNATEGFRAKSIRTGDDSIVFRFAGSLDATDAFFRRMQHFGNIETSTALTALL